MYPRSMADSDCIVVDGLQHGRVPPGRVPLADEGQGRARRQADPRRSALHPHQRDVATSTPRSARARDIAFLGGLINYVINSERWNTRSVLPDCVVNYTNAATIINEDFKDTEDLDGVFSGLMEYKGGVPEWPLQRLRRPVRRPTAWQYARHRVGDQGESRRPRSRARHAGGSRRAREAGQRTARSPPGRRSTRWSASLLKPPPQRDETLQHPRCVFQIVKRHFSRYTPEMVEQTTGCPRGHVPQSGRDDPRELGRATGPPRLPTPSPGRSTPTARR